MPRKLNQMSIQVASHRFVENLGLNIVFGIMGLRETELILTLLWDSGKK